MIPDWDDTTLADLAGTVPPSNLHHANTMTWVEETDEVVQTIEAMARFSDRD